MVCFSNIDRRKDSMKPRIIQALENLQRYNARGRAIPDLIYHIAKEEDI